MFSLGKTFVNRLQRTLSRWIRRRCIIFWNFSFLSLPIFMAVYLCWLSYERTSGLVTFFNVGLKRSQLPSPSWQDGLNQAYIYYSTLFKRRDVLHGSVRMAVTMQLKYVASARVPKSFKYNLVERLSSSMVWTGYYWGRLVRTGSGSLALKQCIRHCVPACQVLRHYTIAYDKTRRKLSGWLSQYGATGC